MKNHSYIKYLKVCQEAVKDEEAFKTFRSHVEYIAVVEACGQSHGMEYLEVIRKEYPHLVQYFPLFGRSEEVGNPNTFYYKEARRAFAPTTLRYIKVLGDLERLFGSFADMDIIEIGGGYGGQCKIIYDYIQPRSYTLVDLPDALRLSEKYLNEFDVDNVIYKTPGASFNRLYSLVISNYAFSEVSYNYQKLYAEKILKNCNRGYLTCNHFGRNRTKLMYDLDIFKLKQGRFSKEHPLTGRDNLLYTWKRTVR